MTERGWEKKPPIPRRPLGKTGISVAALAMGGHHLCDGGDEKQATEMVAEAIDAGVDFFDNCWEYHNGKAELWLGKALKGKRDKVVLMTKVCTHGRDAELAMQMLEESLRRLQTDHLDVWQIHGVAFDDDPELAFRKNGVVEALEKAKKQGKTRFVGFTGHKHPDIHMKMLSYRFPFDTCQFPLNCFDASYRSFEQKVLPECKRQGIGVLGMKSFGGKAEAIKRAEVTPGEMLRYAMSLDGVATTISGMDKIDILRQNLDLARGFEKMTEAEMKALRERCRPHAADGRFELYKGTLVFDNPEARRAHGLPIDDKQKEVKEELEESHAK